jgi:hypothetical protein
MRDSARLRVGRAIKKQKYIKSALPAVRRKNLGQSDAAVFNNQRR